MSGILINPYRYGQPQEVDASYAGVMSMLKFNGADASVAFQDFRGGKIWTPNDNAQLDTAVVKYGSASGLFDGTGDFIQTPNVVGDFTCATDFTVECWIYRTAGVITDRDVIVSKYVAFAADGFTFQINPTGVLNFAFGGSAGFETVSSTATIPLNQWVHVAACKSGSTLRLFINGTLDGSLAVAGTPGVNTATPRIGRDAIDTTRDFQGNIDDFRWTGGIARYTANFTPPTELPESLGAFLQEAFGTVNVGPGLTFTNSNRTISRNISGNDSPNRANCALSLRARSRGKVYVEFTIGRDGSQWSGEAGIAPTGTVLGTILTAAFSALTLSILPSGGGGITTMRTNRFNTLTDYTPEAPNNSVTGMAVDFDAGKIWFANQGLWLLGSLAGGGGSGTFNESDPTYTFTPGGVWSLFGESFFSSTAVTMNVGPTFIHTVPAGFGFW